MNREEFKKIVEEIRNAIEKIYQTQLKKGVMINYAIGVTMSCDSGDQSATRFSKLSPSLAPLVLWELEGLKDDIKNLDINFRGLVKK